MKLAVVALGLLLLAMPLSCGKPAAPSQEPKLRAFYFHRSVRCPSCIKIEQISDATVHEYFAGELAEGRMTWQILNLDEPGNRHFEEDYHLEAQSVVVSEVVNGKETHWKNLKQVWDLVEDEPAMADYVHAEVRKALDGVWEKEAHE